MLYDPNANGIPHYPTLKAFTTAQAINKAGGAFSLQAAQREHEVKAAEIELAHHCAMLSILRWRWLTLGLAFLNLACSAWNFYFYPRPWSVAAGFLCLGASAWMFRSFYRQRREVQESRRKIVECHRIIVGTP